MKTENYSKFCSQKCKSYFENYGIPPGVFEVSHKNNTSNNLVRAFASNDIITLGSKLKTIELLLYDLMRKYIWLKY